MFYESNLIEPPIFDVPAAQYGPYGVNPEGFRSNYSLYEILRPFLHSGYAWKGVVVPKRALLPLGPNAQVEDRIQVPPKSWLLGFSGFSAQAAGFAFTIWDAGTQRPVLWEKFEKNGTSADSTDDADTLVHVLPYPYAVIEPGWLQIRIVNAAAVANDLNLLLHFAVPGNPKGTV